MSGLVDVVLSDDPEAAWARIAPHLAYQWDTYRRYSAEGIDRIVDPVDPEARRRPGPQGQAPKFQVLTPTDAAKFIRRLSDGNSVEHIFFWASIAGMDRDLVERHVELLATELRPALEALQ
jgi:hypothetical protein